MTRLNDTGLDLRPFYVDEFHCVRTVDLPEYDAGSVEELAFENCRYMSYESVTWECINPHSTTGEIKGLQQAALTGAIILFGRRHRCHRHRRNRAVSSGRPPSHSP